MQDSSRLGQHYQRYNTLNTDESNKYQFTSNDYTNVFSNNSNQQLSIQQEPNAVYDKNEHYLIVSSEDRDVSAYPSSSNFVLNLDKEYKNITCIELIQAIVPDKNNITSEPYLLLKINELENTMDSCNKQISESFAILQICNPTVAGTFLQMDKRIYENVILNYQIPKANLAKLSIKITDSQGNIFDFGGSGTTTKDYQCLFVFRITTLDTSRKSLNNRTVY
jgi:hypothetical protein